MGTEVDATFAQSDILREWYALAAMGESPNIEEFDIGEALCLLSRIVRLRPVNWFDAQALLILTKELGGILLEPARYGLSVQDVRQIGAIAYTLASHVTEFIEIQTGLTLVGADLPLERKN